MIFSIKMRKSLRIVFVIISAVAYNLANINVDATHRKGIANYSNNLENNEEINDDHIELIDTVAKLLSCLFCNRDEPTVELVISVLHKLPQKIYGLFENKTPQPKLIKVLEKRISELVDGLLGGNERLLEDLIKDVLTVTVQLLIKSLDNSDGSLDDVAERLRTSIRQSVCCIFHPLINRCK